MQIICVWKQGAEENIRTYKEEETDWRRLLNVEIRNSYSPPKNLYDD